MRLDDGWNQVQFNLADFVKRFNHPHIHFESNLIRYFRAYGSAYVETLRVQVLFILNISLIRVIWTVKSEFDNN